jgi:hypothetical protein
MSEQQDQIQIEVPVEVATQMKVMEFDKQIADAEAVVATLKQQRMSFIYDSNIAVLKQKYQKTDQSSPVT